MKRDTKFNYGVLFVGLALPVVADYFLGKAWGIVVAILVAAAGAIFLVSGHAHREVGDAPLSGKKKMAAYGIAGAIIALAIFGLRSVYNREFARNAHPLPVDTPIQSHAVSTEGQNQAQPVSPPHRQAGASQTPPTLAKAKQVTMAHPQRKAVPPPQQSVQTQGNNSPATNVNQSGGSGTTATIGSGNNTANGDHNVQTGPITQAPGSTLKIDASQTTITQVQAGYGDLKERLIKLANDFQSDMTFWWTSYQKDDQGDPSYRKTRANLCSHFNRRWLSAITAIRDEAANFHFKSDELNSVLTIRAMEKDSAENGCSISRAEIGKIESELKKIAERIPSKAAVEAAPSAPAKQQECQAGSICNQDSPVNAPQIVNNYSAPPGKLTYLQDGNTVTIRAVGGAIESPTLALLFDGEVNLVTWSNSGMHVGDGRVNNPDGTPNPRTIWIFRGFPPISADHPIVLTISSPMPVRLLAVTKGPKPPF